MNAQSEHQLRDKYPELFVDIWGDPRQTAMAWGLECDDGWYTILDTLCRQISHHLKYNTEPNVQPVILEQVKEKYGTLRFYYRGGDDVISGLVQMAEAMSAKCCERCGNLGKIRGGSWLKTLCDKHAQELGYYNDETAYSQ